MNIIIYPISYNKRGEESMHGVRGVTPDGTKVNIKLRPNKKYERSPSIAEFSEVDHREHAHSCIANTNNSPKERYGVLLFTNCVRDPARKKTNDGYENYLSSWGTVICNSERSPDFMQGVGRIDIRKGTDEVAYLHDKILNEEDEEKRASYREKLAKLPLVRLPLIIYRYKMIRRFHLSEIDEGKEYIKTVLSEILKKDVGCGFAVRLLDKNHQIYKKSYREVFQNFIQEEKRLETPEEMVERYFDTPHAISLVEQGDYEIDFIPLEKVFSGKKTTRHYLRKNNYRMIRSLYTTGAYGTKVCNVLTKLFKFKDEMSGENRMLVDRVFSMSSPIGHPMRINVDGDCKMTMVGENPNGHDYSSVFKAEFPSKRNELKRNAFIYKFLTSGEIETHEKSQVSNDNLPTDNSSEVKEPENKTFGTDTHEEQKQIDESSEVQNSSTKNGTVDYLSGKEDIRRVDEIKAISEESAKHEANYDKPSDVEFEERIQDEVSLPKGARADNESDKEKPDEKKKLQSSYANKDEIDFEIGCDGVTKTLDSDESDNPLDSEEPSSEEGYDSDNDRDSDPVTYELADTQEDSPELNQLDDEETVELTDADSSVQADTEPFSKEPEDDYDDTVKPEEHKTQESEISETEDAELGESNSNESFLELGDSEENSEPENVDDLCQEDEALDTENHSRHELDLEPNDELESALSSEENKEEEIQNDINDVPLMFDDLEEYESYILQETDEDEGEESNKDEESEEELVPEPIKEKSSSEEEDEPTGMAAYLMGLNS